MEKRRKCIYHVPNYINPKGNSGSSIRPKKMLQAFKDIGYDVDVVMGYAKERKKQISKIKKNIKDGIKYDFMYSESSTMPTLLTEKHHLPTHPLLDFGFMKFCKKNNIKIALYYRDIYWKFPSYGKNISNIKRKFAISMYNYDIKKYSELLNILYLQTMRMAKYLPETIANTPIKTLPPGCNLNKEAITRREIHYKKMNDKINIFYVGGIGKLYNIEPILKVAKNNEYVNLVICCREDEWNKEKGKYEKYINDRISIVHTYGDGLEKHYDRADLCSLYFPKEEYRNFVMPIKLFEYIGHAIPILATAETTTGDFIEKNNIGWSINSDEKLEEVLQELHDNKMLLLEKYYNLVNVVEENTWEERAKKVVNDLKYNNNE